MLKSTAAGLAAAALPSQVPARVEPTVEEVLFDSQIPVLGNPEGDVTIAGYFDYQCTFCKRGHRDLIDVVRVDGNVRLVMKDWPIFGAASVYASSLVLAASKDYEKALHAVMATKGRLGEEDVNDVLKKAGLDPQSLLSAFKKD